MNRHATLKHKGISEYSGEKVSLRRINLEDNTHVQESNASQLPV
jgi:hypothetical protein